MFTMHPTSEFFDHNQFVEDNIDALRDLYDKLLDVVPSEDRNPDTMAVYMGIAIFEEAEEIKLPLEFDPSHEKDIQNFSAELIYLTNTFYAEDRGYVVRNGNSWTLTELGKKYTDKPKRKKAKSKR